MTTTTPRPPSTDDRPAGGAARADFGLAVVVIVSLVALIMALVAFATDEGELTSSGGAAGGATSASVVLSEFALTPAAVQVGAGGSIEVTNEGSQVHNLGVVDTDLVTPDLANGESATLDVSSLSPGEYELYCEIAGHAQAGMTGTLTVAGDGEAAADDGGHGGHGADADWAALDEAMMASVAEFPAATEGRGNQVLEPEILADGVKRFELTAQIVEWEVEPGKFVEAWTYNGMVPGPWLRADVGDTIQVHIRNELPLGTDIHWHGIEVPNEMDGVAPITQDLIPPGGEFTYEFPLRHEGLGIYHAHAHGHMKVPNGMLGIIQAGDTTLPRGRTISGVEIPADLVVDHELPMVLNDAGTIGLSLNGKSFPATEPLVVEQGDWILAHYANEGLQVHPMHQHQFPQLIVAKDGIPLDNPYWADTVNVAPGERYSVLMQADDVGTWVWHCHILTHVESDDGMFGMVTAVVVQ